jgi:hypothetical protein
MQLIGDTQAVWYRRGAHNGEGSVGPYAVVIDMTGLV